MRDLHALIIGGGPAGASAAALLAAQGARVTLVERERFPRHHVGESLQPASFRLLDEHFGLGPTFAAAGFARKYGALYVWGDSREPWSVLFDRRLARDLPRLDEAGLLAGDYEHAWQVDRARFDQILLDNARAQGAVILERTEADEVLFEGARAVGARLRDLVSGETREVRADAVIDAGGQRCLIGRRLGLTRAVPDLRATATYAYYRGAGGVPGPLGRHVQLVVTVPDGWVWFIPTSPDTTSVGVVNKGRRRLGRGDFERSVADAGLPLAGAELLPTAATAEDPARDPHLRFARDWSFTHARFAGPGWWMAGDAACFVDPILSGGVDFAIRGALNAAVALLQIRDGEDERAAADRYDQTLREEYRAYLRMARYWYGNNRSVEGFFWEAHRQIPQGSVSTPLRAFVYLTSGHYRADQHVKVFQGWQERQMFQALGVDRAALAEARRRQRG